MPSGDPFMVYPTKNGVLPSLRWAACCQAFNDYRALKTLESIKGREFVLGLLKDANVVDFKVYPIDADFVESFREKVNELIKKNI